MKNKSIDKVNSPKTTEPSSDKGRTPNDVQPTKKSGKPVEMSTSEAIHYDDLSPLARITSAVDPTVLSICRRACSIDSKNHSDPEKYFRENIFQYIVATTCWIGLINDVCHDSKITYEFLGQLKTKGLAWVIGTCKDASSWLIEAINSSSPRDIATISYQGFGWLYPVLAMAEYGNLMDILQVLRFLTRFTAVDADALEVKALREFAEINASRRWRPNWYERNQKDVDSSEINFGFRREYYLSLIREVISELNLDELVEFIVPGLFLWSDGHCSDGKTVAQKLRSFAKREPALLRNPRFGLSTSNKGPIKSRAVTVKPVPKNYKKPRLIFPQDSYSSSYLHQMRIHLTHRLAAVFGINLSKQQARNREKCLLASTNGIYDTIDHSSASDCIAWKYYKDTMPEVFIEWLSQYRETSLKIGDKTVANRIALTAGNPCTFVLETIFFYACARVATEIAEMYYNLFSLPGEEYVHFLKPLVYGDDVIIDHRATDVYVSIASFLDLKINMDKSFTNGYYRESCGIEAYQGSRLDHSYWPRKIVGNSSKNEDAFLLASLHNRITQPTAKWYLQKVVRLLCPRMTTQVGYLYSDLQSYEMPTLVCAPCSDSQEKTDSGITPEQAWARERHAVLKSRYSGYQPDENVEMFLYLDFLAHGPYYEDGWMRAAQCSSPRFTRDSLYCEGSMRLYFIEA